MKDDPRLPTPHPPGSPGKIAVLRARARRGLTLFVEGDADGCSRQHGGRPSSRDALDHLLARKQKRRRRRRPA